MKTAMQTLLEDIKFLMPETYKALNKKFELKKFYLKNDKQQKEDFAIGFAEFLEGRDLYLEKITIVEAMEIYKKEKGL